MKSNYTLNKLYKKKRVSNNGGKFRERMRALISCTNKQSGCVSLSHGREDIVFDQTRVASMLNDYFVNIAD